MLSNDELDYAEENVLYSADIFLSGEPDWNSDTAVDFVCQTYGYDADFVWLADRVLFGPAVVYTKTGIAV